MVEALLWFQVPNEARVVDGAMTAHVLDTALAVATRTVEETAAFDSSVCDKRVVLGAAMEYMREIVNPNRDLLPNEVAAVWSSLVVHQLEAYCGL